MKSAVTAAVVAALVASGAGYAAGRIDGRAIALHSIQANRLTTAAVKSLSATSSPRSLAAAVASTFTETTTATDVAANPQTAVATCPAGAVAIGGGYSVTHARDAAGVLADGQTQDGTGWEIIASVPGDGTGTPQIVVYVSCVPTG